MTINIYQDAILRLVNAGKLANIQPEVLEELKLPRQTLEVNIPLRRDDGGLSFYTGYRVQHNNALGPTKGGIRFHPNVSKEEVMALAFWMSLKCALFNLPFGGGKGGVIVDPKSLSNSELERLSRGYMARIAGSVGPQKDIPAPDVYTNATIMAWMMDEYSKIQGEVSRGVITGKPLSLGGSQGRDDATGRGAYYCIKQLEKLQSWQPEQKTVAVQGFGNAGQHVANLLAADGYKVVAVSDSKGGVYNSSGLNLAKLISDKLTKGTVVSEEYSTITNSELLELDVDILIPSALENQITTNNAGQIKAQVIVEVANGPIASDADAIINSKNIVIIPDILANAGGVVVSYFEWVQNNIGYYWELNEVHEKLQQKVSTAFHQVFQIATKLKTDMRASAYVCALQRLEAAISACGTKQYFSKKTNELEITQ